MLLRLVPRRDAATKVTTPHASKGKDAAEPAPTPPVRRILGRVGGLSVARQRALLKSWKARAVATLNTPGGPG